MLLYICTGERKEGERKMERQREGRRGGEEKEAMKRREGENIKINKYRKISPNTIAKYL
jgi:hypothetical protein